MKPDARETSEATATRWRQVKEILADALEIEDHATRTAFLQRACGGDTTLQAEIELLLAQDANEMDSCADFVSRDDETTNVGRRLGAYRIAREIGRGGMGAVYLAERADGEFEKHVAIKLLKRGTDTDEILRRFRAERRMLARLDHPNIARLLDAGTTDDGLPYFVMEHVDGAPITDFARTQNLSIPDRLALFLKVCGAVEAAHTNQVIHRDLKASNILVRPDGEPKLLDFGIAKLLGPAEDAILLTLTEQRRLSPACASPEQARGEGVTPASDVYALGALLYELLTDTSPHRFSHAQPSSEEIARVVCAVEAVRPSLAAANTERRRQLRGDLDVIALTALRKEPERRYASVAALTDDVRRHLDGRPIRARKNTTSYVARRFVRRNGRRIAGAVALSAIGLLLGFVLFRSASQPRIATTTPKLAAADNPDEATHDPEARQLFLRARTLVYEFGTGPKFHECLTSAVRLLEQATTRDPNFVLAYSLLAEAHLYLYER
ncbi:MAG: serine/threonine protein kinase, partial [Verrucomicrobiota bacterium]|nr:serine/threonine protein kinase [Verrucomicrobiota bacterium]